MSTNFMVSNLSQSLRTAYQSYSFFQLSHYLSNYLNLLKSFSTLFNSFILKIKSLHSASIIMITAM